MADERAAQSVGINLKAVSLLVIIVCAAIVGFSKLRARLAWERTVITRGPLHPLTPPITADKVALMAALRARNFDKLEELLTGYESAAEKDVAQETNMVQAFDSFSREDPSFDAPLQEWVKRSPHSYAAHLARAELLHRKGWNARGAKWASETSDEQLQRMTDYLESAEKEARSALAINPKLAKAYALLIGQQMTSDGVAGCMRENDIGLKQEPASFEIRRETMGCLRPRWGGTYQAMDLFAAQAQVHVHENPELLALKGFVDNDRGELLKNDHQNEAAIAYFTRAIAKGGDYQLFYRERGEALTDLNRYADALEDLHRANQLLPQSSETLSWIAYGLFSTGKTQDALTELNLAAAVAGPWPYEQQLRGQIVAALSQHSRDTGASGN